MIYETLKNYHRLPENLQEAVEAFQRLELQHAPSGTYGQRGQKYFFLISDSKLRPESEVRYEAHEQYIDIHIPLTGKEKIKCLPEKTNLRLLEKSVSEDVAFYCGEGEGTEILLSPGELLVIYPGEPHKPSCLAGSKDRMIHKAVIKVREGKNGN